MASENSNAKRNKTSLNKAQSYYEGSSLVDGTYEDADYKKKKNSHVYDDFK